MKLFPINELSSAFFASKVAASDVAQLKSDPRGFVFGSDADASVDVSVVENSDSVMNLALPFYTDIDKRPPNVVPDADMDDASGGRGDHYGRSGSRFKGKYDTDTGGNEYFFGTRPFRR